MFKEKERETLHYLELICRARLTRPFVFSNLVVRLKIVTRTDAERTREKCAGNCTNCHWQVKKTNVLPCTPTADSYLRGMMWRDWQISLQLAVSARITRRL